MNSRFIREMRAAGAVVHPTSCGRSGRQRRLPTGLHGAQALEGGQLCDVLERRPLRAPAGARHRGGDARALKPPTPVQHPSTTRHQKPEHALGGAERCQTSSSSTSASRSPLAPVGDGRHHARARPWGRPTTCPRAGGGGRRRPRRPLVSGRGALRSIAPSTPSGDTCQLISNITCSARVPLRSRVPQCRRVRSLHRPRAAQGPATASPRPRRCSRRRSRLRRGCRPTDRRLPRRQAHLGGPRGRQHPAHAGDRGHCLPRAHLPERPSPPMPPPSWGLHAAAGGPRRCARRPHLFAARRRARSRRARRTRPFHESMITRRRVAGPSPAAPPGPPAGPAGRRPRRGPPAAGPRAAPQVLAPAASPPARRLPVPPPRRRRTAPRPLTR